jgi:hypothetical protein
MKESGKIRLNMAVVKKCFLMVIFILEIIDLECLRAMESIIGKMEAFILEILSKVNAMGRESFQNQL